MNFIIICLCRQECEARLKMFFYLSMKTSFDSKLLNGFFRNQLKIDGIAEFWESFCVVCSDAPMFMSHNHVNDSEMSNMDKNLEAMGVQYYLFAYT